MSKTLIGKNGYLFLNNDTCRELEVHCNNLNLVGDHSLKRYSFSNFMLIVFPNKSFILKDNLPDGYNAIYRPAIDTYKNVLGNKCVDAYEMLNKEDNVYYKTDTHINTKGGYIVYKYFIENLNKIYDLNIQPKEINFQHKKCLLHYTWCGLGDLLSPLNLGNQSINEEDKIDDFYESEDILKIYYGYKINSTNDIKVFDYDLCDKTEELNNTLVTWEIVSSYVLYKINNNSDNKYKVIIFYDSFLLSTISLYLDLFFEVYMFKCIYNNNIIDKIQPDYVFEFRVERFLF